MEILSGMFKVFLYSAGGWDVCSVGPLQHDYMVLCTRNNLSPTERCEISLIFNFWFLFIDPIGRH